MTWSFEFPVGPEPSFVAAPDVWQLADLSYIREAVAAQASEPRPDVALARAAADGHAHGYEEGRLAGERAERARLRGALDAANEALCQVTANQRTWAAAFEDNLCAMATAIARHLMERELRADPTVLVALVQRARREFAMGEPLRVRVNPADLSALANAADAGTPDVAEHWVPDASVAPGGCVVEGHERIVDGRVDTTLERLYRRVTQYDV